MSEPPQLILIVEDNDSDYEAVIRFLRKTHIANQVIRCKDGDEALDYLYRRGRFSDSQVSPRPGIILLDLNLPGTDGKDVLADIKGNSDLRQIPVIVLTTSADERDVQSCYGMGANSYMTKRIDAREFMGAIERMSDFWLTIAILPRPLEGPP
jgi:CheY-like chemotaxis protein